MGEYGPHYRATNDLPDKPAAALDCCRGAFTVIRMVVGAAAAGERQSAIQQKAIVPTSVLDYQNAPANRRPLRVWVPASFLAVVVAGELFGVERLYRWQWPLPGDYLLGGLLLAGAVVSALVTRLPGWCLGLYGLAGLCFFYPGETITREFYFGIAKPGAIRLHIVRWTCALLVV